MPPELPCRLLIIIVGSFFFAVLTFSGCGKSGHSQLGEVTGTVTFKGVPVEAALIVFHAKEGRSAKGRIVAGQIVDVITYDRLNDGAPVGTMPVTIYPPKDRNIVPERKSAERKSKTTLSAFPPRYGDPLQSGLSVEIKPGTNNLTIELSD